MFRWWKLRLAKRRRSERQKARVDAHDTERAYWEAWDEYESLPSGSFKRQVLMLLSFSDHSPKYYVHATALMREWKESGELRRFVS